MASEISRRTNLFTEHYPSIGMVTALARSVRRFVLAIIHRREISRLAELDDHMLGDIGLTRSDLDDARSKPLWQDPTAMLARRAKERDNCRTARASS